MTQGNRSYSNIAKALHPARQLYSTPSLKTYGSLRQQTLQMNTGAGDNPDMNNMGLSSTMLFNEDFLSPW